MQDFTEEKKERIERSELAQGNGRAEVADTLKRTPSRQPVPTMTFEQAFSHMKRGHHVKREGYPYVLFWVKDAVMQYPENGFLRAIPIKGALMIQVEERVDFLTVDNDLLAATDFYCIG